MLWRDGAALVVQVGGPFVVIGVLTRLVALFDSDYSSERAMRLLRRPPLVSRYLPTPWQQRSATRYRPIRAGPQRGRRGSPRSGASGGRGGSRRRARRRPAK